MPSSLFIFLLNIYLIHSFVLEHKREARDTKDGPTSKIKSLEVKSEIRSRFAVTKISSEVQNLASEAQELFFVAQLPAEAFISNFTINRKRGEMAPKKDPYANLSKEDLIQKLQEREGEKNRLNSRIQKLEKTQPALQPLQQSALSPEIIQAIGVAVASAVDGIFEKFKQMMDERDDEKRRRKNVIIFRLPEETGSEEEIDCADKVNVEALCRDMGIASDKIKYSERLGMRKQKPPTDNAPSCSMQTTHSAQHSRPRPLKIRFRDPATKAKFLRQSHSVFRRFFAKLFDNSTSHSLPPVCRPDMNKEDAEKDRAARKDCYEKNRVSDGTKWVVRRGRCVPFSEV